MLNRKENSLEIELRIPRNPRSEPEENSLSQQRVSHDLLQANLPTTQGGNRPRELPTRARWSVGISCRSLLGWPGSGRASLSTPGGFCLHWAAAESSARDGEGSECSDFFSFSFWNQPTLRLLAEVLTQSNAVLKRWPLQGTPGMWCPWGDRATVGARWLWKTSGQDPRPPGPSEKLLCFTL